MVPTAGETGASAPATEATRAAPGRVLVVGGGPAGLTAAYALGKRGVTCRVVEADSVVGGIARTVEREGWRFDIGGHRFFTKVPEVQEFWHEILPPEDFLLRPRLSRIYYDGNFFDYPIQLGNALRGLGLVESMRCGLSYAWVRVRRPKDAHTYEGWVASRFGWRLYRKFFKTYTEKVWGMPATEIQADWAAQRIKTLSLWKAFTNALRPRRNQKVITSLIEEFEYPRLGPGMMWERAVEAVAAQGSTVTLGCSLRSIRRSGKQAVAVELKSEPGRRPPGGRDAAGRSRDLVDADQRAGSGARPAGAARRCNWRQRGCTTATSSRWHSSCPPTGASPTTGSTSTTRR